MQKKQVDDRRIFRNCIRHLPSTSIILEISVRPACLTSETERYPVCPSNPDLDSSPGPAGQYYPISLRPKAEDVGERMRYVSSAGLLCCLAELNA